MTPITSSFPDFKKCDIPPDTNGFTCSGAFNDKFDGKTSWKVPIGQAYDTYISIELTKQY